MKARKIFAAFLVLVLVMSSVAGAFAITESDIPDNLVMIQPQVSEKCPHVGDIPTTFDATVIYTDEEANESVVVKNLEISELIIEEEKTGIWMGYDVNPIDQAVFDEILSDQEASQLGEVISGLDFESMLEMSEADMEPINQLIEDVMDNYKVEISNLTNEHFTVESAGIVVTPELITELKALVIELVNFIFETEIPEDATVKELLELDILGEGDTLYDTLIEDLTAEEIAEIDGLIADLDAVLAYLESDAYQGTVLVTGIISCPCMEYSIEHEYYVIDEEGEEILVGSTYEEMVGNKGDIIKVSDLELKPDYAEDEYDDEFTFVEAYEILGDETPIESIVLGDETYGIGLVYHIDIEDYSGDLEEFEDLDMPNYMYITHEYWAEIDGEMVYVDDTVSKIQCELGEEVKVSDVPLVTYHEGATYEADGFFSEEVSYDWSVEDNYDWNLRKWDDFAIESMVAEDFGYGILVRYVTTDTNVDTTEKDLMSDWDSLEYEIFHEFWMEIDGEMVCVGDISNYEYGFEGDVAIVEESDFILEYMGMNFEVKGVYDSDLQYLGWSDREWDMAELESYELSEDYLHDGFTVVYEAVIDEPQDEPQNVPEEEPQDEPQDVPEDEPQDEPQDVPEDESQDESKEESQDVPQEEPKDEIDTEVPLTGDNTTKSAVVALLALATLMTLRSARKREDF